MVFITTITGAYKPSPESPNYFGLEFQHISGIQVYGSALNFCLTIGDPKSID